MDTYNQKYYQENIERLREKHRAYAKAHYQEMKLKRIHNGQTVGNATRAKMIRQELKDKVYQLLGNMCSKCGFSDIRALQIDHIDGNGTQERTKLKLTAGSPKFFRHILEVNGKGYQILCANCNWIKRYENKEIATYVHHYRD